ncbi:MAG: hypothetical protein JXB62_03640 [Pirellulales bacterium]|nr:hypothetical protein [Pirellulales bacterium]
MPDSVRCAIAMVACHLVLWCCPGHAQDAGAAGAPDGAKQPPGAASPAPRAEVEESQPTLYYLEDEHGNLIAVPGFRWEDFKKYYDLKHQFEQQQQQPPYSLQRISASGTTGAERAELTLEMGVLVRREGWARVPLHLDQAVLREPAVYQGPGEGFVHLTEGGDGYTGWIRGEAGSQHTLTLTVLVPVIKTGEKTALRLHLPRAAASQLKLKVPVANAAGEVSEGATLEPPAAGDNETELTVLGPAGDFELRWFKSDGAAAATASVLTAEGAVLIRIDKSTVESETTLVVRSSGAPFDRFHVRLPPGTELVPGNGVDPAVSLDPGAATKGFVEVVRAKADTEPITVRLMTRRPHTVSEPQGWFEVAGFEVVEAVRQSGHVALVAMDETLVRWREGRGFEQVETDQLPNPLRPENLVAGFEYFHVAQPSSLTVRLVPRLTRVNVEPVYKLLVEPEQVRLEAGLKYTVRGGKASQIDVGLPEQWQLDAVGPENLAEVDAVAVIDSNLLSIPLSQPSTGQIELWFQAHWPIPPNTKSISLPLPQPLVDAPCPATVVVVPNDNVELIPSQEAMEGLTLQQVDPQLQLPPRQQAPRCYRSETGKACFAADFLLRAQKIAVEVTSRISIDEQTAGVEQELAYTIAHLPTDHFLVDLPLSLAESNQLTFQRAGQALAHTRPSDDGSATAAGTVRFRVALPEACIGPCVLVVRYPLSVPTPGTKTPTPLSVPLIMPGDGELTGNTVQVHAAAGLDVSAPAGAWTVAQPRAPRAGPSRGLELTTGQRTERVELAVRLAGGAQGEATVVERAWVQTWLTHSSRQDRAVFRFSTNSTQLELTIPAGTAADHLQMLLDGQRITERAAGQNRWIIALAGDSSVRQHVLELDYYFPGRRPGPGHLSIELPHLGDDVWVRRFYWQLILPQNEHVVVTPEGFISEFTWGWDGYFWGRKPLLGQSDLETWAGVSNRNAAADGIIRTSHQGANHYLFGGLGSLARLELRTAGRTWIVLFASGAALVAGFLLIYVPLTRHPGTLFAAAVGLLCAGLLYPEPALLVSQAASLGLALALLAGLLERSVARRRRETALSGVSAAVVLENGSTQAQFQVSQVPMVDHLASTRTAPSVEPPEIPDSTK